MQFKFEEGNSKLKEGEFENSKQIFSELLDVEPHNSDYITGYFVSSYWDNRIDLILSKKEGKERGNILINQFNEFLSELKKRNFTKNDSYSSATFCILSEASTQFRTAYQKEGISGLNKEVLSNLIMCLTGIGDYKNALEILDYSKKYYELSITNLYYLAECLYHVGEESKSRLYYRMAMIADIDSLNFEIIKSEPISTAIFSLKEQYPDPEILKYYLPVYLFEKKLLPEIPDYSREEIAEFVTEITRLESNLQTEKEEIRFKIECRILAIALTVLESFTSQVNPELQKKMKNKIFSIDPELLDRRID